MAEDIYANADMTQKVKLDDIYAKPDMTQKVKLEDIYATPDMTQKVKLEDIYATPDMTQKVKSDGGEMEERMVDIYVSADTLRGHDPCSEAEDPTPENTAGDQLSGKTHTKHTPSTHQTHTKHTYTQMTYINDHKYVLYSHIQL